MHAHSRRSLPSVLLTDAWRVPPSESDCSEGTFDLTQVVKAAALVLLGPAIDSMLSFSM